MKAAFLKVVKQARFVISIAQMTKIPMCKLEDWLTSYHEIQNEIINPN
jgi:hypothetical protein